jgi:GT2 family glycosyltransferase
LGTISIIIVNYNGKHLLRCCLESIYNQLFKNIQVILVDNASKDGSIEYVSMAFPGVEIVSLPANVGFAGANVEGLKHASGDYIMLLNNDAEVDKDCLPKLYDAMEADSEIGIAATKMVVSGKDVIDSAGDGFTTLLLKGFKRGEGESIEKYDKQEYVFGACAGAALYRRKMLEEIGFFDEEFFLIHEDTDLNFRAQLAGWKALYVPSAIVYHKVRSTIGNMSDTAIYYSLRNSELTRLKNAPVGLFLRCIPSYAFGIIIEFLFFAVKHKKFSVYVKAKWDAIKFLPNMLRKRRIIMENKKVNNKYLYRIMTPFWHKEFFISKARKFFIG